MSAKRRPLPAELRSVVDPMKALGYGLEESRGRYRWRDARGDWSHASDSKFAAAWAETVLAGAS